MVEDGWDLGFGAWEVIYPGSGGWLYRHDFWPSPWLSTKIVQHLKKKRKSNLSKSSMGVGVLADRKANKPEARSLQFTYVHVSVSMFELHLHKLGTSIKHRHDEELLDDKVSAKRSRNSASLMMMSYQNPQKPSSTTVTS